MEFDKGYKVFVPGFCMRRWAFIVVIAGMFVLALLFCRPVKIIESAEELNELEDNTFVGISGEVVSERVIYGTTKIYELDCGVELVYDGIEKLDGERVFVVGKVSEYDGKKQITVEQLFRE
jgi:hypothetical protein